MILSHICRIDGVKAEAQAQASYVAGFPSPSRSPGLTRLTIVTVLGLVGGAPGASVLLR